MFVTHYLFMCGSKIETISLVMASLEPRTPATLRVLGTHVSDTLGKMLIATIH